MANLDITVDTNITDKTTIVGADRFPFIDSAPNPDELKEVSATNLAASLLTLNTEAIQDLVGAMVSNNVETGGIAVTYNDTDGELDFALTKSFCVEIFAATTALATGDGKKYVQIPEALNGLNIVRAHAVVFAKSTSGTPTVQIARGRRADATSAHSFVDVLSTLITIDANEYDSRTAASAPVVNTSNDDLASGDLLRFDVDVAGTAATGLWVIVEAA